MTNATPTHTPLAGELASKIVEAAGDPDTIASLISEDVTWWITPSIPAEIMESVTHGREAMRENLQRVFSTLYQTGTVRTVVHDTISEGNLGAARWTMTGKFANGAPFENYYALWVEAKDGLVVKVWEYTDMAHSTAQSQAGIHS
ncbi:nuclear transport factor 2 family protein [Streptomyces sp. NPDC048473]|uniref:nuclear transport factor 2 family protein n=1 Tax=unclassified Streptomyces TaxID=2593676 RepID=UPI003722E705